jgi:hypothetical protein
VFFFLLERKGVLIEEMEVAWRRHWFQKRFTLDINCENSPRKHDLDLIAMATSPNVQKLKPPS